MVKFTAFAGKSRAGKARTPYLRTLRRFLHLRPLADISARRSPETNPQCNSLFFKLPTELRIEIYTLLLKVEEPVINLNAGPLPDYYVWWLLKFQPQPKHIPPVGMSHSPSV
jgi:hypothetical protein